MPPPPKFRSKRASSSYSSTLTTLGFIALCVFGVWMIISDSIVPRDTSASVVIEDPSTQSTTQQDPNYSRHEPPEDENPDENKPKEEEKQEIVMIPEAQPQPEIGGAGDGNAATNQGNTETRADDQDQESEMPQNRETNSAATISTDTRAESKEEIRQPGNENQVEMSSQNQDHVDQNNSNEDQVDKNNQNQKANVVDEDIQNQNHMGHSNQYTEQFQNQEQIEQVNHEQMNRNPSSEGGGNSKWNPNESTDQISDQDHQRQQEHKQEAEKQQQLRDEAEQQLKLPEEAKANQKVEESEAQMAHEELQKKQAELHNMMSKEEEHKAMQQQQQKSDHKPNGHEFSDQTKNLDAKIDSDYAHNSKSQQQQNNPNEEAKQSSFPNESRDSNSWSTQAAQSENQKERHGYTWQLCNVTSGHDYIPCLDNDKAVKRLRTTKHYEHRERHCPEDPPTCLVPLPEGYKTSITWPQSRDKVWYHNVPHTRLAEYKGHQNWVKVSGEFSTFPGGGTQFIHGAHYYIDFLQWAVPDIAWGKHTRVVLDVGCGVASFGGYLFDKDVLTMSFAPKDEHEAQVQFALERGIPAISAVMGSQRLPFPSRVFDLVHCARCRVPWHAEGGRLLLEMNRILRPGGYFVWSATPVYLKKSEDREIWNEMSALTKSMCLELVTIKRNKINKIAAAIFRKPRTNDCYEQMKRKSPPMCKNDDANAAWYVPLQSCMHQVPVDPTERGTRWPEDWPARLQAPPYWLNDSQMGIYGKPAPDDFSRDYEHWKRVVERSYMKGLGIDWSNVRNVMDMRAVYGGLAAALKDMKLWVVNVVNTDSPDTLPIIYERGLFGIYHDWCESFSSYPRSYDLLHADHLFSRVKKRCKVVPVVVEMDRLVRPGGKIIVRDESKVIGEVENLLRSLQWEVHLIFSNNQQGLLTAHKSHWRPDTYAHAFSSES